MAFIMSLFSESEMMGAASAAAPAVPNVSARRAVAPASSGRVLSEPAPPQVVEVVARLGSDWGRMLNPCAQCRYRGICDDDECAMLVDPIDMPHAPTANGWRHYGFFDL